MEAKNILKIFIVAFLILSLIIFINTIGLNLNESEVQKNLIDVVTIEGLDNRYPFSSSGEAFCHSNTGFNLELACNKLTKYNCGLTSCCVWTDENKCKAGNKSGPIFNSDENGKTKTNKLYYFKNKCYGANCLVD